MFHYYDVIIKQTKSVPTQEQMWDRPSSSVLHNMDVFLTGCEEGSESNRHRSHIWLLCCLQSDWFIDSGKICKYVATISALILLWEGIFACSGVFFLSSLVPQIVQIGAKFMLVTGLFVSAGCTIMFGWVWVQCATTCQKWRGRASWFPMAATDYFCFLFFPRRLLDRVPSGTAFIVLCFVVRSVDAVGFAAAMTSSFAMTAKIFPNNVATVLVSADEPCAIGMLPGHWSHGKTKNIIVTVVLCVF